MLHAMGRDGYAPEWLTRIHPVHQTPRNAQMTVIGVGLVIMVALSAWQGKDFAAAYAWMSEAFVWFVLLFYMAVNAANIVFHWRHARRHFNWLLHGAVPLIGIGVCVWALYEGFFHAELGLPFKTGSSIVWFSLAWTAAGAAVVAAVVRARRPRQPFLAEPDQPEVGNTPV